jgi:hypothetical protein
MIEQLSDFPDDVLAFACRGTVTKADYDTVLVPAVTRALRGRDKIKLYYEIATDFEDMSPGAMWEDFVTGVEHRTQWDRVALLTDVEWMKKSTWLFRFLIPCPMKVFPTSESAEARKWIVARDVTALVKSVEGST